MDCATCRLFQAEDLDCLHIHRPGGLELTARLLDSVDLPLGSSILEIASGAGVTLDYLVHTRGMSAIGLDLSERMLKQGRSQFPDLTILRADSTHIPLQNGRFQGILSECAGSLMGDPRVILNECHRLLAPGGRLLMTDLYIRELYDQAGRACLSNGSCLTGARTEMEIKQELDEAGFMIIRWQDETALFKQWMAGMVFRLGSLAEVYERITGCEQDARLLADQLGKKLKLGYYSLAAAMPD